MNIANEPTYVMALKRRGRACEKYAMVNVQKYQNVAIGDNISECQSAYVKMLKNSGITSSEGGEAGIQKVTGKISRIAQSVIEGIRISILCWKEKRESLIFRLRIFVEIVRYDVGDSITLEYMEGDPLCVVTALPER